MNETDQSQKKRALILAGGGMKVAFQAGVLQVWLDEAGLTFDYADGTSGGTFNLAMYCQGMTGTQIADNWRNFPVSLLANFNWKQYIRLFYADSILSYDRFRKQVFPKWGLDWNKIRASGYNAGFNVYNFSKERLESLQPSEMTEDYLIACASLPMWFPSVIIDGETYIDAVFITDANIEKAIQNNIEEIWVIWTVSRKNVWNPGFVANYFQIVETCANGHFKLSKQRIAKNNDAFAKGQPAEFGRHIELRIIKAEVPLHYLINLSSNRIKESVNMGVQAARKWCKEQRIQLKRSSYYNVIADPTTLFFTEEMQGYVTFDKKNSECSVRDGKESRMFLMLHLTVKIYEVNHFLIDPNHEAAVEGYVRCQAFGENLLIEKGKFNLFVDEGDPTSKKMLYRLFFYDNAGLPLTLSGFKSIKKYPGINMWAATTTLFTRIMEGHVELEDEANTKVVASGTISIHFLDFLKQLTTFRVGAPTLANRVSMLIHFSTFFLGKLWDVYGQKILPYGPF